MRSGGDDAGGEQAKRKAETGATECQDDVPTVLLARRLRARC
jgi:hypothetical protein